MTELLAEFSSSWYLTDTQLSRLKRIPAHRQAGFALNVLSSIHTLMHRYSLAACPAGYECLLDVWQVYRQSALPANPCCAHDRDAC